MNRVFVFLILSFLFFGCDNKDKKISLKIVFDHKVGDKDLTLNNYNFSNSLGYNYKVTTLRYFTSDFKLYNTNSSILEIDTFHYRDVDSLHSKTTELLFKDIVWPGTYNGFSLTQGLKEKYNRPISVTESHSLPNVEDYNDMYWPWQEEGQYHYMKFEGWYKNGNSENAFKLHTGPTLGSQYYFEVPKISFPIVQVEEGDTLIIHLQMDLSKWIDGKQVYDFYKYGSGIMKNPEAQTLLKANGPSVYSISKVEIK